MSADEGGDGAVGFDGQEHWDATNFVALRKFWVVIDVDLADDGAVLVFVCELCDERGDGLAGSTPRGSELDEDGLVLREGFLEGSGVNVMVIIVLYRRCTVYRVRGPCWRSR